MDAFGLPEVSARVDPSNECERLRAHEAVLYAAYRMVREKRELAAGEMLEVPIGLEIGALPVRPPAAAAVAYSVAPRRGGLTLEARPRPR
jgi:hypothetical protein